MRVFWIKVVVGALAVFLVGLVIVTAAREGVDRGRSVFASSDPITIPLPPMVPFTLDGAEIGRLQRITIRRDAPRLISGFHLRVELQGELPTGVDLRACQVSTPDREAFNFEDGFVCVSMDPPDSQLVAFGSVRFRGPAEMDVTVPLVLASELVQEIRHDEAMVVEAQARFMGEASRLVADRVSTRVKAEVDSLNRANPPAVAPVPPDPPRE